MKKQLFLLSVFCFLVCTSGSVFAMDETCPSYVVAPAADGSSSLETAEKNQVVSIVPVQWNNKIRQFSLCSESAWLGLDDKVIPGVVKSDLDDFIRQPENQSIITLIENINLQSPPYQYFSKDRNERGSYIVVRLNGKDETENIKVLMNVTQEDLSKHYEEGIVALEIRSEIATNDYIRKMGRMPIWKQFLVGGKDFFCVCSPFALLALLAWLGYSRY